MDPATLAAAATSLLAPYLAKAGGAILNRATAALPDEVAHLWNAITKHFEGKPAAAAATDLAQKPSDQDQQALFALQLKMAIKDDPDFAAAVQDLIKKASGDQQGGHNVTITSSITNSNITGGAVVSGNSNTTVSGSSNATINKSGS